MLCLHCRAQSIFDLYKMAEIDFMPRCRGGMGSYSNQKVHTHMCKVLGWNRNPSNRRASRPNQRIHCAVWLERNPFYACKGVKSLLAML